MEKRLENLDELMQNIKKICDLGLEENLTNPQIVQNVSQYANYYNQYEFIETEVSKETIYFVNGTCCFCKRSGIIIPF